MEIRKSAYLVPYGPYNFGLDRASHGIYLLADSLALEGGRDGALFQADSMHSGDPDGSGGLGHRQYPSPTT